ncbi:Protein PHR1-LIKE 3 [Camellia lanceoleosa]|uniref:Protein PHR1-LIKE 3 n=1 Tax=Camellia lanceoleosa TaxID=1840588 RepID=A0ACC0IVQ9_9ERIC|nr:Protein PHR1-LIKE 3 [Camellia lanceoleosa]
MKTWSEWNFTSGKWNGDAEDKEATPKTIMRTMGVKGLALYHLKSHLQESLGITSFTVTFVTTDFCPFANEETYLDLSFSSITTTGGDGVVGDGGGGLLVKEKGRPRKYESDGNLRLPSILSPPSGFSFSPPFPSSSKRGRGRPLDSGNCQLLASLVLTRRKEIEWFIEGDFDAYVERIRKPYENGTMKTTMGDVPHDPSFLIVSDAASSV